MTMLSAFLVAALAAPLPAQWLHYPTPGMPRTADGKPNLSAPPPRTADGKPDLSGISPAALCADGLRSSGVRQYCRESQRRSALSAVGARAGQEPAGISPHGRSHFALPSARHRGA